MILLLVDRFHDGGVEKMLIEYIKTMGVGALLVVLEDCSVNGLIRLENERISFLTIGCTKGYISKLIAIPQIISVIRNNRPDKILSAMTVSNLIASLISFSTKIKPYITVHGPIIARAGVIEIFKKYIIYKTINSMSSGILCVSKRQVDHLRLLGIKSVYTGNWIESKKICADKEKTPVANENKIIVWVGRLEEDKQPLLALRAYEESLLSDVCELHVFGTGSLKEKVSGYVAERGLKNVILHGHVEDWRMMIKDKKITLLLSSKNEAFGLVCIEALSMGGSIIVPSYLAIEFSSITNSSNISYYDDMAQMVYFLQVQIKGDIRSQNDSINEFCETAKTKFIEYIDG